MAVRVGIRAGDRILHYLLIEPIGEGGMGVVWRAEDTTLGRDVAVKVLPDRFATDADRLARLEREARLLAALDHPNIATVYSLHEHDGMRFLAMEFVAGEDLAARLERGPLGLDETLAIGLQLAEALEAAHGNGVIHRDLKPANIRIAPDGTIKVLDFGLAKALEPDGAGSSDPSASPTMTSGGTVAGVILGTASYMSPEQARGHAADRRADLWSLGCVLYEMLTGSRPFTGDTVSDTLAAVLTREPDWDRLPAGTPPSLRRLLRRCLEKNRHRRLHDAADARLELDDAATDADHDTHAERAAPSRSRWPIVVAALGALAIGWLLRDITAPPVPEPPVRHFFIPLDASVTGDESDSEAPTDVHVHGPAISPDGGRIAYTIGATLFIRELDRDRPREIDGIDHPRLLFWSPDGRHLGFVRAQKVWRVPVEGGAPEAICDLPGLAERVPTWSDDDTISFVSGGRELRRVSANGGDAELVEPADSETIEDLHGVTALPGGRGVVVVVHHADGSNRLERWSDGRRVELLRNDGPAIVEPRYVRPGYVLYVRRDPNGGLWALPISPDATRSTGEPFRLVSNVKDVTASNDGTLVYEEGARASDHELVWITFGDHVVTPIGQPQVRLSKPALSPDGSTVAVGGDDGDSWDVWLHDMRRPVKTRLTALPGSASSPRWSPDGSTVLYAYSGPDNPRRIYSSAADGSGEPREIAQGHSPHPSSDWTQLVFVRREGETGRDIWLTTLDDDDGEPNRLVASPANEFDPALSDDGAYLAYVSDASGRREVYVTTFPEARGRWQASTGGGVRPQWGHDGRTLYFEWGNTLWSVGVTRTGDALSFGTPEVVLDGDQVAVSADAEQPSLLVWNGYHVPPGGDGVLTVRTVTDAAVVTPRLGIHVIENWRHAFGR